MPKRVSRALYPFLQVMRWHPFVPPGKDQAFNIGLHDQLKHIFSKRAHEIALFML